MPRSIETNITSEDKPVEHSLRPTRLKEYIGQEAIKEICPVQPDEDLSLPVGEIVLEEPTLF